MPGAFKAVASFCGHPANFTIFAGLSITPSGKHVTSQHLYDAVIATPDDVAGYWLNGEPQPQVAMEVPNMLSQPK